MINCFETTAGIVVTNFTRNEFMRAMLKSNSL